MYEYIGVMQFPKYEPLFRWNLNVDAMWTENITWLNSISFQLTQRPQLCKSIFSLELLTVAFVFLQSQWRALTVA